MKAHVPPRRRYVALLVATIGLLLAELLVATLLQRFTSTPAAAAILSVLFAPLALIAVASPLYRIAALGFHGKTAT